IPSEINATSDPMSGIQLWGLYDIHLDPATGQAEVVPMRTAEMELNLMKFLYLPGKPAGITISDLEFNPPEVNLTIGIRHPLEGYPQFTAFSVRGILLTNGTKGGYTDPALIMSGPDELRLTNADGFTRWMNPVDFPFDHTVFCYMDWPVGNPDGDSFTSTINPYKYYADVLDHVDDTLDLYNSKKCAFSHNALNTRRYELDFGEQGLENFQFAVVASWEPPFKVPPQIPDDFPLGTTTSEPWNVEMSVVSNDLWFQESTGYGGGELVLQAVLSDFEDAYTDLLLIEAPGVFPRQEMDYVSQDGIDATFELNVEDIVLTNNDPFEVFIAAVAPDGEGFNGLLPGEELALYAFYEISVLLDPQNPPCPDFPFWDDFETTDCVWTPYGGDYWGVFNSVLDATGGGPCYEEDTGNHEPNPNTSYVSSKQIDIPESDQDLVLRFSHTISVDPPEYLGHWAWDMCFVMVNFEKVYPTGGPPYEDAHIPYSFNDFPCWTGFYDWVDSEFNLGTQYNGTTITIKFYLDTHDYILNCDPPYFGWYIDDLTLDFE
ncbi:hypothetical protein KAU08_10835, partial [bacterium]|nr:hypothetical protein [bacterium]